MAEWFDSGSRTEPYLLGGRETEHNFVRKLRRPRPARCPALGDLSETSVLDQRIRGMDVLDRVGRAYHVPSE